jgi:hypothetical protein
LSTVDDKKKKVNDQTHSSRQVDAALIPPRVSGFAGPYGVARGVAAWTDFLHAHGLEACFPAAQHLEVQALVASIAGG